MSAYDCCPVVSNVGWLPLLIVYGALVLSAILWRRWRQRD